jgi:hypothetical protein
MQYSATYMANMTYDKVAALLMSNFALSEPWPTCHFKPNTISRKDLRLGMTCQKWKRTRVPYQAALGADEGVLSRYNVTNGFSWQLFGVLEEPAEAGSSCLLRSAA